MSTKKLEENKPHAPSQVKSKRRRAGRKPLPEGMRLVVLTSNVRPLVKAFYDNLALTLETVLGREVGVAAVTHEALSHSIPWMCRRYGVKYAPDGTITIDERAKGRERDPITGALREPLLRVPKLPEDGARSGEGSST